MESYKNRQINQIVMPIRKINFILCIAKLKVYSFDFNSDTDTNTPKDIGTQPWFIDGHEPCSIFIHNKIFWKS